jgi:cytochrome b involved in lipid metabolism
MTSNNEKDETGQVEDDDRHMNDSTLPPAVEATSSSTAPRRREKVPLNRGKGFGLADWNQLTAVAQDLAGLRGQPPRRDLTWSEIAQHNTVYNGWIVLRQRVYFITPYLPYHPGGERVLMNVLGKDATALFERYHAWVNIDALIGKLLIGYLAPAPRNPNVDTTKGTLDQPVPKPPKQAWQQPIIASSSTKSSDDDEDALTFDMPPPPPSRPFEK